MQFLKDYHFASGRRGEMVANPLTRDRLDVSVGSISDLSDQQLALDWGILAEPARDSNAGAPFSGA